MEGTISSVVRIPMVITYVDAIKDFSLTRKKSCVKTWMNAKQASGHAQKTRRVTICKGASAAHALKVTMEMANTFVSPTDPV